MITYWICTDWLKNDGKKIMGPFVDDAEANRTRTKLELLHQTSYYIDSEDWQPLTK